MCWSDIDKAGVFESSRCEKIGNRLISKINSVLKPQTSDNENLADSSQAVQQLKAKIAALADEVQCCVDANDHIHIGSFINKLRQLERESCHVA